MSITHQESGDAYSEENVDPISQQNENMESEEPAKRSSRLKTWLVIGTMRYGTKKTEDELNKRAKRILDNPSDYSPFAMGKRKLYEYYDYKFVIHTSDLMHALEVSERHAQRLLQITRKKLNKNKNDYVTVKEFCDLHKINELETRRKITRRPSK